MGTVGVHCIVRIWAGAGLEFKYEWMTNSGASRGMNKDQESGNPVPHNSEATCLAL